MNLETSLTFDDVQIVPMYSEITSRSVCNVQTKLTKNFSIGSPLIAAPMDSVCDYDMVKILANLGCGAALHRFMPVSRSVQIISDLKRFLDANMRRFEMPTSPYISHPIIVSVGAVGEVERERAELSVEAGADIILIDVAHGDHIHVKKMMDYLNKLSNRSKFDVIAGNVATAEAALRLEDWGADALRVGIGGGSMCETRIRTGVGIPQLSAIAWVSQVTSVPVISDGGIRTPGDVAKALAIGADSVMIGSLFAGTDEAPGEVFVTGEWPFEKKYKMFRGSASASAKMIVKGEVTHVEGNAMMIPFKGSVSKIVKDIEDGIKSSMSYVGAKNLTEFRTLAKFIRITNAGLIEAHPHGLK